jgi:ferredoxin
MKAETTDFLASRRRMLFPASTVGTQPFADEASVNFESRGMALVTGPAAIALPAAKRLAEKLRVLVCAKDATASTALQANPSIMLTQVIGLSGFLGRFTARVPGAEGKAMELGAFSGNSDGYFDMVLDLGDKPLISIEVTPLGYFSPGSDVQALDAAIAEMQALVGRFRKQRYFAFDERLCTHAAQGVAGCSKCLEACPALAIRSKGSVIEVNPFLCQGCATCTLVCPTGAIRYATPVPALKAVEAADQRRLLVQEADNPQVHPVQTAPFATTDYLEVPTIASVVLADWLQALSSGYQQVVICPPVHLPQRTRSHLQAQVALAQALMTACGRPADAVILVEAIAQEAATQAPLSQAAVLMEPALQMTERRSSVMASLKLLEIGASAVNRSSAAAFALPQGSPFGNVRVKESSCTLCMACVNLCPTSALGSWDDGVRSLQFVESRCVQCGICAGACPEKAIALQPRLLVNDSSRKEVRTLHQDSTHHCTECGTGFISTALLAKSLHIMQQSKALDSQGITLMRMCPSCRSRTAN